MNIILLISLFHKIYRSTEDLNITLLGPLECVRDFVVGWEDCELHIIRPWTSSHGYTSFWFISKMSKVDTLFHIRYSLMSWKYQDFQILQVYQKIQMKNQLVLKILLNHFEMVWMNDTLNHLILFICVEFVQ